MGHFAATIFLLLSSSCVQHIAFTPLTRRIRRLFLRAMCGFRLRMLLLLRIAKLAQDPCPQKNLAQLIQGTSVIAFCPGGVCMNCRHFGITSALAAAVLAAVAVSVADTNHANQPAQLEPWADGHLPVTGVFLLPLVALFVVRYVRAELSPRGICVRCSRPLEAGGCFYLSCVEPVRSALTRSIKSSISAACIALTSAIRARSIA